MDNKRISIDTDALKVVLDTLLSNKYYGAGECTEIAKGKYEYSKGFRVNYRKLKRLIKSK